MIREQCVLDDVFSFLGRFNVYPSVHARRAVTTLIARQYLHEAFDYSPLLAVVSAVMKSGKSRVLEVVRLLSRNPTPILIAPSPASIYTATDTGKHSLVLIDEMDRLYERRDTSEITAILDACFRRGGTVPRTCFDKDGKRCNEYLNVYTPFAFAGIDNMRMPDTILSRCIPIRMPKRLEKEKIEPFREKDLQQEANALKERLEAFRAAGLELARTHSPFLPDGIADRYADKWESLFTVADVADVASNGKGVWGRWIREAALALLLEEEGDIEPTENIILLKDLEYIKDNSSYVYNNNIATKHLLQELYAIAESPWSNYRYGRSLSDLQLGRLLKPFKVRSRDVRISPTEKAKGYCFGDLYDPFQRHNTLYTPSDKGATSETDGTDSEVSVSPIQSKGNTMTQKRLIQLWTDRNLRKEPPEGIKSWDKLDPEFAQIPEEKRQAIYEECSQKQRAGLF